MDIGYEGNFFEDNFVMQTNDDVDISVRLWSFSINEFDWVPAPKFA